MSNSLHSYKGEIKSQKRKLDWLSLGPMSAVVQSVKTRKVRSYKVNIAVGDPCEQMEKGGTGTREWSGEEGVSLLGSGIASSLTGNV